MSEDLGEFLFVVVIAAVFGGLLYGMIASAEHDQQIFADACHAKGGVVITRYRDGDLCVPSGTVIPIP